MAKKDLQEYKKKKDSAKFAKLYSNATQNSKLNSASTRKNVLKVHTLIDIYFGVYRGTEGFYFFENESGAVFDKIKSYLSFPYGEGKYQFRLNPILAISTLKNNTSIDAFSENTLVFCEEGIAFDWNNEFNVIPYENVKQVTKKIKRQMLIVETCYVFLVNKIGDFSTSYVLDRCFPPAVDVTRFNDATRNMIARSIYDFICCFSPDCQFINK